MLKSILFASILACTGLPAHAMTPVLDAGAENVGAKPAQIVKIASKKLIGTSRAARIAQRIAPQDKLLGVRLSKGRTPMYVVKTKGNGRVREIVIDAQTGAVLKR
ncbi:MAG: PepSY domain-containing protein [Hyphomicrobiales bacterium]